MNRSCLGIALMIAVILVLGVYGAGSWFFASVLIDRPTQTIEDGRSDARAFADYGLPTPEDVTIENGNISLQGMYFDNDAPGECAALLMHGYTGTRYGTLPFAPLFWEYGCDLLAYDHRGHGESSEAYHTYGFHEKDDAMAALAWLQDRTGLDQSDLGMLGVSYGAATAIQAAPQLPDLAFIVADSPYEDLETVVRYQAGEQFGTIAYIFYEGARSAAELRGDFETNDVSAKNAIAETEVPVLIIHSLQDEFTLPSHSEAIYANSNPAQTVFHLNDWGSPHARDILTDFGQYQQQVDDFIAEYAPQFGQPGNE